MNLVLFAWLPVAALLSCSAVPLRESPRPLWTGVNVASPRAERADYRLPQEVIPTSYVITLAPNFDGDTFPFTGTVEITATPNLGESTTSILQITLHAHQDITVLSVRVTLDGEDMGATVPTDPVGDNEFLVIPLGTPITSDGTVVINIAYNGILNTDMRGFYRSSYNEDDQTVYLATTHMEPTGARRAFPCFDEPGLRATFQVNVLAPEGYTALSNTAQSGDPEPQEDGSQLYRFLPTPVMSSYLVAVVVSQYSSTVSPDDEAHSVWSRPGAATQRDYAASLSATVLQALDDYTGIAYSDSGMTKMDQVAVPDFTAGAMENWGLVTYRERLILLDEAETSTLYRKNLAKVISHEYSHQWFGDRVGPAWWNVIWLNEGFATFFEYHITDTVESSWRLAEQFVVDEVHAGLAADSRLSSRAITPPEDNVLTQAEISNVFDDIGYSKAGSVLRMISHILGEDVWKSGLNGYLTKMKGLAAGQDDLISSLVEAATTAGLEFGGNTLEDILHSWTDNPGHPVVTVTRDRANNTATLTQSRFLLVESTEEPPSWITPLTWATTTDDVANTSPQQWLVTSETLTIEDIPGDGWFVLNNQRSGFYRVQYDAEGWAELIALLQADSSALPPLTQAQLLDDAFWLARAGQLDYTTALDLTLYLPNQQDYIPWTTALSAISYIQDRLYGGNHYQNLQTYLLEALDPLYQRFSSFEVSDDLSHTDRLLINLVLTWECDLGQTSCRDTASQLFSTLPGDGTSSIAADVRSVVYCNGVRMGGEAEWNALWNHYLQTNVASEKTLVLSALGCSSDVTILENYLSKTTNGSSDIRAQDYSTVYSSVYNNPVGWGVAVNHINSNADNAPGDLTSLLSGLASKVTSQEQADQVAELATELGLSEEEATALAATTSEHLSWSAAYQEAVGSWLAEQVAQSGASQPSMAVACAAVLAVAARWAAVV